MRETIKYIKHASILIKKTLYAMVYYTLSPFGISYSRNGKNRDKIRSKNKKSKEVKQEEENLIYRIVYL